MLSRSRKVILLIIYETIINFTECSVFQDKVTKPSSIQAYASVGKKDSSVQPTSPNVQKSSIPQSHIDI